MNKPLRYHLSFIFFLPYHSLTASSFFSFAGMCTARTLADMSMLPVAFGGRPIRPLAKLLHDKLGTKDSCETSPTPTQALPKKTSQNIGTEGSNENHDSQNINLGNLPHVIHATVASIKKDSEAPVYLNLNLNNQQVSSHASTKKLGEPVSLQNTHPELSQDTSSHTHVKTNLLQSMRAMGSWIKNNKFRFFLMSSGGFIGSLQALLWYFGRILTQQDCWSCWQSHSSLPSLYQMNQKELINELLKHLQQQDMLASPSILLERFVNESEKELRVLNHYSTLSKIAQKWPLNYLMFTNSSLLETIPSRIARLSFIKNLVLGWLRDNQDKGHLFFANSSRPKELQS